MILEALGIGDVVPVSDTTTIRALASNPLTPVHGRFERLSDGSVKLQCVRRSRIDYGWRDGVDQMMAEPQEQYLVALSADGVPFGSRTVSSANQTFSASEWHLPEYRQFRLSPRKFRKSDDMRGRNRC